MLKPLLSWIFGPHIFEIVAFFLAAAGLAMALSPSKANIQASHWFFGASFLMLLGRAVHWLVTNNNFPYPKPIIAALLFAVIGGGWMVVYQWVEKQIQELSPPLQAGEKLEEPRLDAARVPQRWIIQGNRFSQMPTPELCQEAHGLAARIRKAIDDYNKKVHSIHQNYNDWLKANPGAKDEDSPKLVGEFEIRTAKGKLSSDYAFRYRPDGFLLVTAMLLRVPAGSFADYQASLYQTDLMDNSIGVFEQLSSDLDSMAAAIEEKRASVKQGVDASVPPASKQKPPKAKSDAAVGNLIQGPGSIAQLGGSGNQATIINNGPPAPKITWVVVDAPTNKPASYPLTAVRISVDRAMESAKFAVICDRPCTAFSIPRELAYLGMMNDHSWGPLPDMPNVAAFLINEPNPLPADRTFVCVVESTDDTPVKIVDVKRLEFKKAGS